MSLVLAFLFIADMQNKMTLKRLTQGGVQVAVIDPPIVLEPGTYQVELDASGQPTFKRSN
jgi:hypothetical protein